MQPEFYQLLSMFFLILGVSTGYYYIRRLFGPVTLWKVRAVEYTKKTDISGNRKVNKVKYRLDSLKFPHGHKELSRGLNKFLIVINLLNKEVKYLDHKKDDITVFMIEDHYVVYFVDIFIENNGRPSRTGINHMKDTCGTLRYNHELI